MRRFGESRIAACLKGTKLQPQQTDQPQTFCLTESNQRERPENDASANKQVRTEQIDDDSAGNLTGSIRPVKQRKNGSRLFVIEVIFLLNRRRDDIPRISMQVKKPRGAARQTECQPANIRGRLNNVRNGFNHLAVFRKKSPNSNANFGTKSTDSKT